MARQKQNIAPLAALAVFQTLLDPLRGMMTSCQQVICAVGLESKQRFDIWCVLYVGAKWSIYDPNLASTLHNPVIFSFLSPLFARGTVS